jgi:hypothetical protein
MVETAAPESEPLKAPDWTTFSDEKLLEVRMCDLKLSIEGTELEPRIAQLNAELDARGLAFRPHYYLSDEWFTPDGVPSVAIPFYLAHPRLAKLEKAEMLEVEGGDPDSCMRILRHEAGHAIDNAYQLQRRHTRRRLFGNPATEYPEYYTPKPYSKSFVQHLDHWYAQSHPDEIRNLLPSATRNIRLPIWSPVIDRAKLLQTAKYAKEFGVISTLPNFTQLVPSSVTGGKVLQATVSKALTTLRLDGRTVKALPAGRYTIVVADRSPRAGFRLVGPGLRKRTSVRGIGRSTWNVALRRGTYRYGSGRLRYSFSVR